MNAARMSAAPAAATTSETSPDARTRPRCSTTTASPGVTSSSKCVAHNTATPRSRTRARTWRRMADLEATSRPTVGSSNTRTRAADAARRGRFRSVASRPPDNFRTCSRARSARSISRSAARAWAAALSAAADAVQRGVIQQVFHDRDVEIEGAGPGRRPPADAGPPPVHATRGDRARRSNLAACRKAG